MRKKVLFLNEIYKDAVITDNTEGPKDLDTESSFLPEVPEDHKVLGIGSRNEGNTQKTSDYDTTMDLYVSNIDTN